jgi:hypothetical protein
MMVNNKYFKKISSLTTRFSRHFALLMVNITIALILVVPAQAAPIAQAYYQTPTPGADGRIIYIVKEGDTCISVSLLSGITMDQLRELNNIQGLDCPLIVGQKLLLGTLQQPTNTPGPTPTTAPILPTPTQFNGNGQICVVLYEDLNGNGMAETGEIALPNGAVSIADRPGKVSLTGNTTNDLILPVCFDQIPEGDYNITIGIPEGYNATTNTNYPLRLGAGDQVIIDFGAQQSARIIDIPVVEPTTSPLLGILGGMLILIGIGLAVLIFMMKR